MKGAIIIKDIENTFNLEFVLRFHNSDLTFYRCSFNRTDCIDIIFEKRNCRIYYCSFVTTNSIIASDTFNSHFKNKRSYIKSFVDTVLRSRNRL